MKVELKKIDKFKRMIKVNIDGEGFLKDKNDAFMEIGKNLKVSGFRMGNVPLDVLEKHHSRTLKEEFLNKVLTDYYRQALEEAGVIPVGLPCIHDVELADNNLSFSAEFEVKPEIEICPADYQGIKINDKKIEVKEEETDKVVANLREGVKKVLNRDLDDEKLAKWAGYASRDGFIDAVKGEIIIEKLRERRRYIESQVTDGLFKRVKVEVSKSEIDKHHKELVDREIYNLSTRGISEEDLEKYKKDIEEKLMPIAEGQLKLFYIMEAIIKKENLTIGDNSNLIEIALGYILSEAEYKI